MDHGIGGIQNILGGAVVFFQTDHTRVRIFLLEIQDVHDIGTTEFVDRLVIVTDNAEIVFHTAIVGRSTCQKTDQLKLCRVGILILVHQNVAETVPVIGENVSVLLEHLDRFADEIIKVKCIGIVETLFVFLIGSGVDLAHTVALCACGVIFGTDQLVFGVGDDI